MISVLNFFQLGSDRIRNILHASTCIAVETHTHTSTACESHSVELVCEFSYVAQTIIKNGSDEMKTETTNRECESKQAKITGLKRWDERKQLGMQQHLLPT